uniref:TPR_REGION domain-containing protein n=1 Tax=Bursaphelenchus xylophilus TaxID=6326 RepID=A0A1I7SRG4_BURXY
MANKINDSCAPTNAAQNLARTYGTSNAQLRSGVERQIEQLGPSGSKGDQFAQEYLSRVGQAQPQPNSINVRQLLNQPNSSRWADEFSQTHRQTPQQQMVDKWAVEFRQRNAFNMNPLANELPNKWAEEFQQVSRLPPQQMHEQWSKEFDQWIDNSHQQPGGLEAAWAQVQQGETLGDEWAKEFAEKVGNQEVPTLDQATLDAEFDKIFHAGMDEWSGVEEMSEYPMEYQFAETNQYANSDIDLMAQGSTEMRNGNTQEAILLYEAQVQKNPRDAEAWCKLGFCHAENEHDIAAMSAFKKALEVDPQMREALLGFSVSLANENYSNEALTQLERWLDSYKGVVKPETANEKTRLGFYGAFIDPLRFQQIENGFLEAARAQTNADPELQNALGVLYNLNGTFDRAVDSIKTAIARSPDDPRLWNRLGATLANSDRTAEAIEAYRHALQLFPAYVRARYNLGISCMHLNCYREAVDHFVNALKLQKANENSPIWSTLRSALIRMENTDSNLMAAVNNYDIEALQRHLPRA